MWLTSHWCFGESTVECNIGNNFSKIMFILANDDNVSPILGADTNAILGLIKRVDNVKIDTKLGIM